MAGVDPDWDNMLKIAEYQQQEFYELMPGWTKYDKNEYKYLKQNIGFALFGPPSEREENITIHADNIPVDGADIFNSFCYKPDAEKIIDTIFKKICEFGEGYVDKESIYYGLIFNLTFRTKNNSPVTSRSEEGSKDKKPKADEDKKPKADEDKKPKADEDEKPKADEDEKPKADEDKKLKVDEDKEPKINIQQSSVFKIKRSTNRYEKRCNNYEIWYVDTNARVYKSWTDYKKNNVLPPCTMVLPKDGFYQPDPEHEITDVSSKVWLEIDDSPACSTVSSILSTVDKASNIIGLAGLGLGIASIFTPIGPVILGATAAAGINGVWTIGRSSGNLIDRSRHEESLTDRNAFCSWLAITGSTVGIAASGGNTLLTRAVHNGAKINTTARLAYNSLLLGNLGINGIGVAYQAYCIYERYQERQEISTIDVLSLGTHILFFGNSVLNLKFAGELIESTQGRILDDYRNSIRSKRLRKQYNRTKRAAAANNTDQASENAEVIRYVNKKIDLQSKHDTANVSTRNYALSFEHGKIIFDGVVLLDPMKFVIALLTSDRRNMNNSGNDSFLSADENNDTDMFHKLKDLLINLLINLHSNNENAHLPDIDEFDNILHNMKYMKSATHIFSLIFEMSVILLCESMFDFQYLVKVVHFFWCYIKENLRHMCLNLSSSISDSRAQTTVNKIIIAMFEHKDEIIKKFLPAIIQYISE